MNKKKILVTGIAGFIGSNLADRLLVAGHEVLGIDNLSYGLKEQIAPEVIFHKLDIRSKDIYPLFEGIDMVFHMAAKNCLSDCQKDPVETADINVVGTVNVLEAASRAKVRKVIYAESSDMYGGLKTFPTNEEKIQPETFYANSKAASHFFAQSYVKYHQMNITGLRYFNVYGPRQDWQRTDRPIVSEFIIQLLRGERPILYGEGRRSKDYIYVDDINDFHLLAMENDATNGEVYNLGSGTATSFKELLDTVQKLLGKKVEPELRPSLSFGVERTEADISKARALGWEPKTSLEEGLRLSIDYIKKHVIPKL
ncbi:hypothetical protein A3B05_01125 [Candidatus Giovannonibacteria bacterium RIFCSPLOWO2_01_FULL_43_160]|uniref:NAD-dependent epimerase/dehydratase domain-containing protein n=2 Tax=Candidatus Giovannoniibacteriota TaxID=1752738 RepID=A0A0G1IWG9_9BACT|nr:MAG: hypothetical protein UV72_C0001G0156 [Candidatus Giovannonibacteria bacterium GW2011_GWB1_43_13]KKS99640.1 MAG: hypothetical protein UV75_C0002G0021 [Candidatus Giovannonibacteria bacterium GW2011_GWA1_43_15]KKT21482.1 MAG: hypothetical protein UW05_C0009G0016 [Candidatus Giovannonibacteria bacterium GW2011_GWC2_43_8]KKT63726.1 MAG: hypothetical protein UW55_C0001G0019 [Candidatus Giovannonibacteria bacterium GW2011_GWA2_44_26]OGF58376.1 MAG: hypothetical protein A2652_00030 [Candidatus